MPATNLLAFDYGASGGRAILGRLDEGTLSAETVHRFPNGPVEVDGHLHWDFQKLLAELKRGIALGCQTADGPVASLGIDTWGVDFGLLDRDGKLIGHPYHYRDSRNDGMCEQACQIVPAERIFDITGVAFLPFNTVYQLLAAKTHTPRQLDRAETMLMMPDLLAYHLTGCKTSEYTIASTSQLLEATGRSWSPELINRLGLPEHIFTQIEHPGAVKGRLTGSVRDESSATQLQVVAVAGHDTASAVVAVPLAGKDAAYLSAGTWSLLGVEVDSPVITDDARRWNFTNEGGTDGRYRLLRNMAGMWLLQECKESWDAEGNRADYADLGRMAAGCDSPGCFIDPDHETFARPGDMPNKVRGFCEQTGQEPPEGTGQTVRCILESLALKYRWTFERLERVLGRPLSCLHIVGGGSRNELLNRFTASAINRPVLCGPTEATAIGNLMMQARALGEANSLEEIRQIVASSFPPIRYEPEDPEQWNAAYQRFEELID